MRLLAKWLYLSTLLPFLLGSSCPTEDPPPPPRLKAPYFTFQDIVAKPDYNNQYQETILLKWNVDSTDTISPIYYCLIRTTSVDSNPSIKTNIPTNLINGYLDPIHPLGLSIIYEEFVYYRIFTIDSLWRSGDTSAICTVSVAREVIILHPGDTITNTPGSEKFTWLVPQIQQGPSHSFISIWKNDSIQWTSDAEKIYTGGGSQKVNRLLPDSLSPLNSGVYYWGVSLIIIGGLNTDPKSITIRKLYVKRQ